MTVDGLYYVVAEPVWWLSEITSRKKPFTSLSKMSSTATISAITYDEIYLEEGS
jgi:hypothetical protein